MPDTPRTLLTQAQMAGGVEDLANQIAQVHAGASEIALVGIHTRGVPLARRIAAALENKGGLKVHFGTIDITQYRDDLSTFQMVPKLEGSDISFDVNDIDVVLCDEVIYTGRSVRAALDELLNFGRPRRVQLAVLVDRCGRELPVQPDYSALKVTLQPGERVAVRFAEVDASGDSCTIETQPASR
jgi:pyrimidine operon attenuation protein/uracil phosphoribosyltransferase